MAQNNYYAAAKAFIDGHKAAFEEFKDTMSMGTQEALYELLCMGLKQHISDVRMMEELTRENEYDHLKESD